MTNKAFLVRDGLRSGSTLVITSTGSWVGNTITELYGGTNQTSYTEGDILYASGGNTLAKLGIAGNGDVLTLAGGVPSWATPVSAPNSFGFVIGDIGSPLIQADRTSDVLKITGGAGVSTSVSGSPAILVITNDSPNVDQNLWLNMDADSGGPVAANTTSDTFTITGGTSITTSISGDAVTITNDAPNVDQNIWLNIGADSGGPVAANTTSDTLTLTGGDGVDSSIAGDAVTFDVDASVARMDAGSPTSHLNVGAFTVDTVNLGSIGTLTTSTLTTTSISQVAVAAFAIATYRSAEFTVQAVQGANFHTTKLLAVHDGVLADSTEYGTITLPSFFGSPAAGSPAISGEQATYDVDINGGNLRLLATPTTTSSTVFKVTAQLTKV